VTPSKEGLVPSIDTDDDATGPATDVVGVRLHDGWLRAHFASGAHADFHLRWLRHNADEDRHPVTRERTLCSSELAPEVVADAIEVRDGDLFVRWSADRASSRYTGAWLLAHAYAADREEVPPPPSALDAVTVHAAAHDAWRSAVHAALDRVRSHGIAIVRGRLARPGDAVLPEDETEDIVLAFLAHGLRTTATHFGRIEDLRPDNTTNPNSDQLGYTNAGIELHTDQPFLEEPPRYQVLQCIRPAARGGESFFVDALASARFFGSVDAAGLEVLQTTKVRFHRTQRAFEKVLDAPILGRVDAASASLFRARFSYFTLAPHRIPFARMEAFYRAHDAFTRLVRDARHQRRVILGEGEFVLYDNHRTLHARTAFEGPRWLRGVYFDEARGGPP
jgi:hypothetical protein